MQIVTLFQSYFRKVKEKQIKNNFVLIYELLDEVCDNGIPQITDPATLKSLIMQKGTFFAGAFTYLCSEPWIQQTLLYPGKWLVVSRDSL